MTTSPIRRRTFLSMALCTAAAGRAAAQDAPMTIRVGDAASATMPLDYTGLSYESPQLYNPDYFSPKNKALIRAVRALGKKGNLRFGANLSDVARWKSEAGEFITPTDAAIMEKGKEKWEWKLTGPWVREHKDAAITPLALSNLRGFLDAVDWTVIYGLNYGTGSPERAADEAAHAAAALGERLVAFQVGNEPDQFKRYPHYGDKAQTFDSYYADYLAFVAAVRQAVPHAPFAGPDTALRMDWVEDFAKRTGKDAVLLTSHIYHMGPARDPSMTAEVLLAGKSRLPEQIEQAKKAVAISGGVPFRLTEVNSCTGGGRPGVSDAFASALWGADMMLQTATGGYAGVNLHSGGDGYYAPIEVTADGGTGLRPLYFGMQFANLFSGAELFPCEVTTNANVTAYAGRRGRERLLAVINKGPADVSFAQAWVKPVRIVRLTATGIEAKTGVTLKTQPATRALSAAVPRYSALLLTG